MKFLFHIGCPKTATTFLQESYFPCHEEILFIPNVNQWNRWVLELDNREKPNAKIVATSDEGISGRTQSRVEILKTIRSIISEPLILVTTRAPNVELLKSIYSQAVRMGFRWSADAYFEKNIDYWRDVYAYDQIHKECVEIFGGDNVLFLPLELLREKPTEFYSAVEKFIGVSAIKSIEKNRANSSLSGGEIVFYRKFRKPVDWLLKFRNNKQMPLLQARVHSSMNPTVSKLASLIGSLLSGGGEQVVIEQAQTFLEKIKCSPIFMDENPYYDGCITKYINPS